MKIYFFSYYEIICNYETCYIEHTITMYEKFIKAFYLMSYISKYTMYSKSSIKSMINDRLIDQRVKEFVGKYRQCFHGE